MGSDSASARAPDTTPAFLAMIATILMAAWNMATAWIEPLAQALGKEGRRFSDAHHAQTSMGGLGIVIVALVAAIIVPIVIISLLAQLLPDYLSALGDIFAAFDSVNTTGWPPIVATLLSFAPLILGATAIGAVFGLGALLVIKYSR